MRLLRSHWGFFLLLLVAAALIAVFCWQDGIASMGDDSVSYLLLARHFTHAGDALIAPWVPLHAHFGPLFPLALAVSGGAEDWRIAHMLVGAFGLAALAVLHRLVRRLSGGAIAAWLTAVLFLAAPTAWVSMLGILSEPLFLLLTLLALDWHARRLQGRAPTANWAAFGLLLAAACLTRSAGVALLAAFTVHAGWRFAAGERRADALRMALPLAITVVAIAAWWLLRPAAQVDGYRHTGTALLDAWRGESLLVASAAARSLAGGWLRSFLLDEGGPVAARAIVVAAGVLGVAGALLRAARNRLDGWYVLATLAMLAVWVFDAANTRRLLYPVVPLLLFHAGHAVSTGLRAARRASWARIAVAASAAALLAATLPAAWITVQKARDDAPFLDASAHSAAGISDYYAVVDRLPARALAAKHAAVLTGFELLARLTPPDAAVMWVRPEYVALLGQRRGIPYEYAWDERVLAREAWERGASFIVVATLAKTDLAHRKGDPLAVAALAAGYASTALAVPNVVAGGDEFVLLHIDRERLRAYLAR